MRKSVKASISPGQLKLDFNSPSSNKPVSIVNSASTNNSSSTSKVINLNTRREVYKNILNR